jgi:hypothetical protein
VAIFVARCLSSYVGNAFGLHHLCVCFPSTRKKVTYAKRTVWSHIHSQDVDFAQDRFQWRALVNTVMNIRVQYKAGNSFTNWATSSFSRTIPHGVRGSLGTDPIVRLALVWLQRAGVLCCIDLTATQCPVYFLVSSTPVCSAAPVSVFQDSGSNKYFIIWFIGHVAVLCQPMSVFMFDIVSVS